MGGGYIHISVLQRKLGNTFAEEIRQVDEIRFMLLLDFQFQLFDTNTHTETVSVIH